MSQCGADSETLAASLKNISYYCFNLHNNCGDWCKFHQNPDTYTYSTIGEGFKDPRLLEALKCLVLKNFKSGFTSVFKLEKKMCDQHQQRSEDRKKHSEE
ncbi:hypothetical protein PV325_004114 [Microctonus aethiopoides]|nr:hypothetical protein PV325_004114 [Microctonus aethiopoides]